MRYGAPEKEIARNTKTKNDVTCENALSTRGKAIEIIKWLQSKKYTKFSLALNYKRICIKKQGLKTSLETRLVPMRPQPSHGRKNSFICLSLILISFFLILGLVISITLPCYHKGVFIGVVGTDISMEDLVSDINLLNEGQSAYAFMTSKSGRTIVHPLLPAPTDAYGDPVYLDIRTLQPEADFNDVFTSVTKYVGVLTCNSFFNLCAVLLYCWWLSLGTLVLSKNRSPFKFVLLHLNLYF